MMINTKNLLYTLKPQNVKTVSFGSAGKTDKIQSDVFERTTPIKPDYKIEEKDNSEMFQRFLKFAEDTDLLSKISEITSSSENYVGSGFEGETYKIPGNDDWYVKKYRRSFIINLPVEKPTITEINDITPGLNIGQDVANIRIPNGKTCSLNYYVMKRQNGKPFGIPYDMSDFTVDSYVKKYNLSLAKLASSPDKTFDVLINDVKTVTDFGYEFDYNNPDNFFYEDGKSKINFVDVHDKLMKETEQYEHVLFALTSCNFLKNYISNDDEKVKSQMPKTQQLLNRVEEKYTSAMKRHGAKFTDNEVTEKLINYGVLCNKVTGSLKDKKTYLRENNLLK